MDFHDWLLNDSKVILFDGAMGTEVIKHGIKPGELPDILNIQNPKIITKIHKSYYEAGSDMCQTSTFSSNYMNLKKYGKESKLEEINRAALKNIKEACPPDKLIVGDIGPTGEFKIPIGKATHEDWYESFSKQIQVLNKGVDLWHIETMSDLDEMKAAIQAVKDNSNKPIIGSMTYRNMKKGFFTLMGDSLKKCVEYLENNCDIIGSNCTLGSVEMFDLVQAMKNYTKKPISIKPNAGKPERSKNGKITYDQPIDEFVNDIKRILNLGGVKIVGGCCGTSPQTIEKINEIIIKN